MAAWSNLLMQSRNEDVAGWNQTCAAIIIDENQLTADRLGAHRQPAAGNNVVQLCTHCGEHG